MQCDAIKLYQVGVVEQSSGLFSGTIKENIAYGMVSTYK
jgi:ABC-type multidrug transport system fused ATPase/permease subunit